MIYTRTFFVCTRWLRYDRDPANFDSAIGVVVDALGDATYINVFLSDLRDEDHAATFESGGISVPPTPSPGKRNRVCDAVRATIVGSLNEPKYLLTVVHSFLSRTIPLYEELLEYLRDIRVHDKESGASRVDRALKYAAVVVKGADILYDAALGTYDFDLVIMVAKVAQKDPKE